jgi:hypothetical protein
MLKQSAKFCIRNIEADHFLSRIVCFEGEEGEMLVKQGNLHGKLSCFHHSASILDNRNEWSGEESEKG